MWTSFKIFLTLFVFYTIFKQLDDKFTIIFSEYGNFFVECHLEHSAEAPSPLPGVVTAAFLCRVPTDTRQKVLSKEAVVDVLFAEPSLPSVTLSKVFDECFLSFAECLKHSTKPSILVVIFPDRNVRFFVKFPVSCSGIGSILRSGFFSPVPICFKEIRKPKKMVETKFWNSKKTER
jgi:hypothetical protein